MTREEAIECLEIMRDGYVGAGRDTLNTAISALRERPRWISVEERLPEDRDWVLVWHTGYATPKKAKYKDEGIRVFVLDGHCYNPGEVTHWMPLPESPKEETT